MRINLSNQRKRPEKGQKEWHKEIGDIEITFIVHYYISYQPFEIELDYLSDAVNPSKTYKIDELMDAEDIENFYYDLNQEENRSLEYEKDAAEAALEDIGDALKERVNKK